MGLDFGGVVAIVLTASSHFLYIFFENSKNIFFLISKIFENHNFRIFEIFRKLSDRFLLFY